MRNEKSLKKNIKRTIALLLVVCMVFLLPNTGIDSLAKKKSTTKLTLSTAKKLAVANSEKMEAYDLSIDAKQAAKASALKSLSEKQKNMSTFRWSPLLSFKFPTKPNEAEAFEFSFKPSQLQNEIEILKHKQNDQKLVEYEKVSTLFVDICSYEEKITFYTARKEVMEETIGKLEARVKLGAAEQGELDKAQTKLSQIESKLANAMAKYETKKAKLGAMIGLDLSEGYTFENPFVSAEMGRSALTYITDYAIDRDEGLYEARNEEALTLLSLRINYSLMTGFYGSNVNMISGYIIQVINGGNLNKRAFKKDYDAFLKKVDDPWRGNYKIWFIKFPKEWLKGSLDGVRYVEDDPYVLYQNAIDYQSARKDADNTQKDLEDTIEDGFNNYVEVRQAYMTAVQDLEKAKNDLIKGDVQYYMGEISADEYQELEDAVNNATTAESDALAQYSTTTYNLDRTTCGGVSAYFESQNIDMTGGDREAGLGTGVSPFKTMSPIYEEGITYSIDNMADDNVFELRINVPADFSVSDINYFELYCDKVKIGERTPINKALRHMVLALSDINTCEVRFYSAENGGYITTGEIDPSVSRGKIPFIKGYNTFTADGMVVGEYEVQSTAKTGTLEIKIKLTDSYGVSGFAVKSGNVYKDTEGDILSTEGGSLFLKESSKGQYSNISESYTYLDAVSGDLKDLTIVFTDDKNNPLFEATFGTEDQSIVVPRSQLEYITQYQSGH